jgi:hypothetical protein
MLNGQIVAALSGSQILAMAALVSALLYAVRGLRRHR